MGGNLFWGAEGRGAAGEGHGGEGAEPGTGSGVLGQQWGGGLRPPRVRASCPSPTMWTDETHRTREVAVPAQLVLPARVGGHHSDLGGDTGGSPAHAWSHCQCLK